MTEQRAYDGIPLSFDGEIVVLKPSLRAAKFLEALHGGFPTLLRKIAEFDTLTVWQIITATAGKEATDTITGKAARQPLSRFAEAAQGPLFELTAALLPKAPQNPSEAPKNGTIAWSDAFDELYKIAAGRLGWTPADAWNATPQEIIDAFDGHIANLKAMHGTPEEQEPDPDQRAENIALGLDPEFDRVGLQRLKAISTQNVGQVI